MILILLKFLKNNWKLCLILAVMFFSFVAGWHSKGIIVESHAAKELQQAIEAKQQAEKEAIKKSSELEEQLKKNRENSRQINHNVEKEIAKSIAYTDCKLSANGMRLLNQAIVSGYSTP